MTRLVGAAKCLFHFTDHWLRSGVRAGAKEEESDPKSDFRTPG